MREIKFRDKTIDTGEWLYGNLQVPKKKVADTIYGIQVCGNVR